MDSGLLVGFGPLGCLSPHQNMLPILLSPCEFCASWGLRRPRLSWQLLPWAWAGGFPRPPGKAQQGSLLLSGFLCRLQKSSWELRTQRLPDELSAGGTAGHPSSCVLFSSHTDLIHTPFHPVALVKPGDEDRPSASETPDTSSRWPTHCALWVKVVRVCGPTEYFSETRRLGSGRHSPSQDTAGWSGAP